MKTMLICGMLLASNGVIHGAVIPPAVLQAISESEGGTNGKSVKEKNGRFSHGVYQISTKFLKDVNKHYRGKMTVKQIRDDAECGKAVCKKGLEMIIVKRKCSLRTALAIYNGGYEKRNTLTCKNYASRVIQRAEEIERTKE